MPLHGPVGEDARGDGEEQAAGEGRRRPAPPPGGDEEEAVERGDVDRSRYESYLTLFDELKSAPADWE